MIYKKYINIYSHSYRSIIYPLHHKNIRYPSQFHEKISISSTLVLSSCLAMIFMDWLLFKKISRRVKDKFIFLNSYLQWPNSL